MSDESRDLLQSFGKLFQNREFLMVVGHQPGMGGHGGPNGGRGQMRLLQLLHHAKNGMTNADIAEILDIRPSSVSATISRLEDMGLAERVPSKADKRAVIVKLSDRGQEMFDQYDQRVDGLSEKIFGGLDADEQAALERLLTKLNHQVGDLDWADLNRHGNDWPHHGFGPRWF
ncbi:transcriptional regulator [Levilactobacillus koreensis JCM 16448]|uniref:MarR family transcriptional regulator n=1 Tax=Levilactobacillus koreensis TaxID=637971 RepID=A0AAC8ZGM5_9LACO|nr:MarR family transcriptional regulator [Levilactobacillus koreensis]AKP64062.1 MarR family transcriptional regulator [Levilactobacillus koreensis]KRK89667.1 transcriptional regulator [Levilactobacillus koreensis JCM 16448]